ncbi:MAG: hypothetical protein IPL40_03975 [Proteobacteria bacterium]|nr:hypothetical protein [Pseudomonadota bacterium]
MMRPDRADGGRLGPRAPRRLLCLLGLALLAAVACRRVPAPAPRDQPAVVVVESDEDDGTTPSVAEHEPNDEPRQAQALKVGQAIRGTLKGRGRADRDWYALEVDRPKQITRLQLGPLGDEDLRLDLYTTPGQRIAVADNAGPGAGEVLPNLALEVGPYLVRVRARVGARHKTKAVAAKARSARAAGASSAVASGSYRLLFALRDRGEQEEIEPNDLSARATDLRFGESSGEAVGYCGARKDVDWYRLAPRTWPADRLLHLAADGLDGVRFDLAWRDAGGQVIAQREARANEGAELANLQLPPPGLGATLTVDCRSGYDLDVPYVLRLGLQPAVDTEREPNDRFDQATALAVGQPLGGSSPIARMSTATAWR